MGELLILVLTVYLTIAFVAVGLGFLIRQRRGGAYMASLMFRRIPLGIVMSLLRMVYAITLAIVGSRSR